MRNPAGSVPSVVDTPGEPNTSAVGVEPRTNKGTDKQRRPIQTLVCLVVTGVVMVPFLWMLMLSFKDNSSILNDPLSLPNFLNFENYKRAFSTLNLALLYKNTFTIAALAITIELFVTFLSSFALTRLIPKHKWMTQAVYLFFIAGQSIPPFILLFPVYRITLGLGLMNTYWSLVFPYVAMSIGFNTLLFVGFLRDFPAELEEAAVLDGAGLFTIAFRVVLPVVTPIVVTIFIFNVLYIWNEFPFAVTLISDPELTTIPLAISFFKGQYSIDYGGIVAASLIFIVPQLIFFALFQKKIIGGMTAGAVKG